MKAAWLTLGAIALIAAVHFLPRRADLAPVDFVAGGPDALEFCDPANPRFLAVVAKASPVTLAVTTARPPRAGTVCDVLLALRTASGKPIGSRDLVLLGGARLRLWAIDASLADFHHLEAQSGSAPGEWHISFTPRSGGVYRFFADLEPAASGREFYASADLQVGRGVPVAERASVSESLRKPYGFRYERRGPRLTPPVYARQPVVMSFPGATRLVAFDHARSGLLSLAADAQGRFRATFADPGRYSLWAWDQTSGREIASGVSIDVLP